MPTCSTSVAIISPPKDLLAVTAHIACLLHFLNLSFLLFILFPHPALLSLHKLFLAFDESSRALALLPASIVTSHLGITCDLWLECAFLHLILLSLQLRLSLQSSYLLFLLCGVIVKPVSCGSLRRLFSAKNLLVNPLTNRVESILVEIIGLLVSHYHFVESHVRVCFLNHMVV